MKSSEIHRIFHCLKKYKQHSIVLRRKVVIYVRYPMLYFLPCLVMLCIYEFNYIFYSVLLCHACNHIAIKFSKKGPGRYLIRVDLIRFPGSIPGAR